MDETTQLDSQGNLDELLEVLMSGDNDYFDDPKIQKVYDIVVRMKKNFKKLEKVCNKQGIMDKLAVMFDSGYLSLAGILGTIVIQRAEGSGA